MKQTFLLILVLMISSQELLSQDKYAWCPEKPIISPRNGFLQDKHIALFIYDKRKILEKTQVKCSGEVFEKALARVVKDTYTSADIDLVTGQTLFEEPKENWITIKIEILKYHVALETELFDRTRNDEENLDPQIFPDVTWSAVSNYSVEILVNHKGQKLKMHREIHENKFSPRIEDIQIAKDILNTTFNDANQELIIFIDNVFIHS